MPYWRPGIISILSLPLILLAGCSRGQDTGFVPRESSTGHLEISVIRNSRTYSFRSDPDGEFLRSESWTGGGWVKHQSVVFNDGRFRYSVTSNHTKDTMSYETRLSDDEMDNLLQLIIDSGLMQHDHKKARVANLRNPMRGRQPKTRNRYPSVRLTIQLAEDKCPGRRSRAPITARISVKPWAARSYPEVPELQAAAALVKTLDQNRDKVEPHIETHPCIVERVETAFIGTNLFGVRMAHRDHDRRKDKYEAKANSQAKENHDGQVFPKQVFHKGLLSWGSAHVVGSTWGLAVPPVGVNQS